MLNTTKPNKTKFSKAKKKRNIGFLRAIKESANLDLFPEVDDSSEYVRALRSNWGRNSINGN